MAMWKEGVRKGGKRGSKRARGRGKKGNEERKGERKSPRGQESSNWETRKQEIQKRRRGQAALFIVGQAYLDVAK